MTGYRKTVQWIGWLLCSLGGLFVLQAQAQELTGDVLDRWLESQPALQAWAMEHKDELEPYESADELSDLKSTDNMLRSLRESGLYEEAASVMDEYGFNSPEEWADVTIRTIKAYLANELEGREADIEMLKAQLSALEEDDQVPQPQKDAMLQALRGNLAMVELVRSAPENDRMAVKPHMEKIRNHMAAQAQQAPQPYGEPQ